jgi:hypothetical protein
MAKDPKDEQAASFSRRQILHMGWSVPVSFGLTAIFPKMADAGAEVVWHDQHTDKHTDAHTDHWDASSQPGDTKSQPGDTKIYQFKQSLIQDVAIIRKQVKIIQAQLNMAQEGQALSQFSGGVTKVRELFLALSGKINAQTRQGGAGNLQKLSTGASNAIIIVNGLEQKIGVKSKAGSLEQLNQLDKLVTGFEADINSL